MGTMMMAMRGNIMWYQNLRKWTDPTGVIRADENGRGDECVHEDANRSDGERWGK